jgi:Tfp pilus assembly protein PilN
MMIEINLLPKDLQRSRFHVKLDKNLVMVLSGCVALIGVMAIYSYFFQAQTLSTLDKQLAISKAETAKYTSEIVKIDEISQKKEQILARMTTIQLLDKNREYWVSLLGDLAGRVPEYVWLTSIRQAPEATPVTPVTPAASNMPAVQPATLASGSRSTLEGYSFSLNAMATFLIRLKKSDYFAHIEIASIKLQQLDKADAYNFKLNCDLVTPAIDNVDVQTAQAANTVQNQF